MKRKMQTQFPVETFEKREIGGGKRGVVFWDKFNAMQYAEAEYYLWKGTENTLDTPREGDFVSKKDASRLRRGRRETLIS